MWGEGVAGIYELDKTYERVFNSIIGFVVFS